MVKVGDPAHLPEGLSQQLLNVFHRPGPRIEARYGWKSDAAAGVEIGNGYMLWFDPANNGFRLVLSETTGDFHVKNYGAETWGSAVAGAIDGVLDYTNLRGRLYWMANIVAGVPQRYSYDGNVLDVNPFSERLSSQSLVSFQDRLWIANVYQYVFNQLGATAAYGSGWTATNVNVRSVVSNGITTVTFIPSSTSSAKEEVFGYNVPASSSETMLVYRSDMRGQAPTYRMPVSLEIYCADPVARLTAYSLGAIRVPDTPNGYRYRVTVAGTTAAGAPAWGTTIGGTTADGTVTWVNDGPDWFVSKEVEVENATDNQGRFQTEFVTARIPPMPSAMTVNVRFKFGIPARTTWELWPIDIALKDGLTDGDVRKKNHGQQLTVGRFFYEFFNVESDDEAAIHFPNRFMWCEPGDAKDFRPANYSDVSGGEGGITVIRRLQKALAIFKRNTTFVYTTTGKADLPALFAGMFPGVGCIGTRAIAEFEGALFFVGEQEVYIFDGSSAPTPIVGDGMREAIFDRNTATWVENQGTSKYPLLRIHEKNRQLWLYTQKATLWIYDLDSKKWSAGNVTKDANEGTSEITDLAHLNNKMYAIAETNKIVREDSATTKDEVYVAGVVTGYNVTNEVWLHPMEAIPREDTLLESIGLHHKITGTWDSDTLEVGVSTDGGISFPKTHTVTVPLSTGGKRSVDIVLWQREKNLTVRLKRRGKTGPTYFNIFWTEAWIQEDGLSLPQQPTTVSASL
jgi:hypothetical protein